jgi:hypothetical protein
MNTVVHRDPEQITKRNIGNHDTIAPFDFEAEDPLGPGVLEDPDEDAVRRRD